MSRRVSGLVALLAITAGAAPPSVAGEAEALARMAQAVEDFEEGRYLELTANDPDAALAAYGRVLAAPPPPHLGLPAQLRRAACLEQLGRTKELRQAVTAIRELTDLWDAPRGPVRYLPSGLDLVLQVDLTRLQPGPLLDRVRPGLRHALSKRLGIDLLYRSRRLTVGRATGKDTADQWLLIAEGVAAEALPGDRLQGWQRVQIAPEILVAGDPDLVKAWLRARKGEAVGLRADADLSWFVDEIAPDRPCWLVVRSPALAADRTVPSVTAVLIEGQLAGDLDLTARAWLADAGAAADLAPLAQAQLAAGAWLPGSQAVTSLEVLTDAQIVIATASLPARLARGSLGSVTLSRPDLVGEGQVNRAALDRYIRQRRHQIESCFRFFLNISARKAQRGYVTVQFNIDEDGNVSKALVIERTLRNPRLDKCLTERIRRWRLPPPEGGSVIVSQSYHVGRWW